MNNVVEIKARNTAEGRLSTAIINNADKIAHALAMGKDVEIRKTAAGISVSEIRKHIIVR